MNRHIRLMLVAAVVLLAGPTVVDADNRRSAANLSLGRQHEQHRHWIERDGGNHHRPLVDSDRV